MLRMKNQRTMIKWSEIIVGIIFLIAAYFAFISPVATLLSFAILFGLAAIFRGIIAIIGYSDLKKITGQNATLALVIGILEIIVGIVFLFNMGLAVSVLAYTFAFWFIIDSVSGLLNVNRTRALGNGAYWFSFIINLLGVVIGISLLFNPITAGLTLSFLVGFYFLLFGIESIVLGIIKK
ncbi:hypothetical protein CKN82_05505 [Carnobacterium divergens]|nr:hypothetical protein CKN76_05950 [Carnobacterium divergens]TFI66110.1 hypothetical protein CKN59_05935 [Carnobacterium divergens]TFI69757.1 hypothetical protein CKN70_05555 [Carnobacterium divergens]TFI80872.1 hypothetical protein CKN74_05915 [Carnobacterium divergens]TFI82542.1 hypothetical protein CKN68_05515 [Carnobacterium divergens]